MTSPTDWFHIYQTDVAGQGSTASFSGGQGSDATFPPATISSPTTLSHLQAEGGGASPGSVTSPHLTPEGGRVSKPIRRRSRASRRTPTTLLNTDAANFRAMVQQFTGSPTASFSSSVPNIRGPNFSTGSGTRIQNHLSSLGSGYQIDFHQGQQFPRQPQPQQQRPSDQFVLSRNYRDAPDDHEAFLHLPGVSTSSSSENKANNEGFRF
ncbi:hypothetical protein Nepgr_016824 [Nepenthes gracilis]|uniref:VQ domain-containing protein n=1 Tax=Nepenthes gracilis TaxID=150966 RepID=A0AAD3XRY3_NEPGR|nr:hypothetical protein Nepgr_016824 [Nepenthes gracilis]